MDSFVDLKRRNSIKIARESVGYHALPKQRIEDN